MSKFWSLFMLTLVVLSFHLFFLEVARCQSDSDHADLVVEPLAQSVEEGGDIKVAGNEYQNVGGSVRTVPGLKTVCVFPNNPSKLVVAGEETELLVGMKNEGEQSVKLLAIHASIHLPNDHRQLVQDLSAQPFKNASIPASAQATFPYKFAVSKFLQPGTFDLFGTIVYEVQQRPYQNIFYNGTIEVTEAGGLANVETIFLISLGIALLALFGLWVRGHIQSLSKNTKRSQKVKTGSRVVNASMDEWLQGTAYTRPQSNKPKKKK
uniref:translocon-associated protein subunit alpha-like n=1 Tax=Erigeron canadensis TaxID=72917 RepID=UPI001CB90AB7|nr:translocon-associated protein subunit alpha-like [Erigeron canadensis]